MRSIQDRWVNGEGFPDTLVIDGHIHVGEWPHNTTFQSAEDAAEKAVKLLDAHGIDAFCAASGGYIFNGSDYRLGNDFLLATWRLMPERMIPFLNVNPNDTRENILAELDRMRAAGVRGIKLINAYQADYPGDGPNMMTIYEYAAERRMLVFSHSWQENEIMKISAQFSSVDFIFAHYGAWCDPVLKARDNVYANIWTYGNQGWLDRGIRNCGAAKFMFGSDGFLNPLSVGLGPVVFAPVSDGDKRLILGLTLARLLDRAGALPAALKSKARAHLSPE